MESSLHFMDGPAPYWEVNHLGFRPKVPGDHQEVCTLTCWNLKFFQLVSCENCSAFNFPVILCLTLWTFSVHVLSLCGIKRIPHTFLEFFFCVASFLEFCSPSSSSSASPDSLICLLSSERLLGSFGSPFIEVQKLPLGTKPGQSVFWPSVCPTVWICLIVSLWYHLVWSRNMIKFKNVEQECFTGSVVAHFSLYPSWSISSGGLTFQLCSDWALGSYGNSLIAP